MATAYMNAMGQNYRQGTVGAVSDVIQLGQLLTWGQIGFQVTGTWVATLNFEVSVDGTNFVATVATPAAGGAAVGTVTGNGVWTLQNLGFSIVQVRVSAYTSGTPTISIRSLPSQV